MERTASIILIDANAESTQALKVLLKSMPSVTIEEETTDLATGYELISRNKPAIAIINLSPEEDAALKVAQKIAMNCPDTTMFVTSSESKPELIIRAMRAGAREYLMQPYRKEELASAVKSFFRSQQQNHKAAGKNGKIISVFGVKGGIGTTTIATNLAVAIANHTKKETILIDLNLQMGNTALFLNLKPKYSILDVAKNIQDIDIQLLKDTMPKHSSGLNLLPGPSRIEDSESFTESNLFEILTLFKSIYDYIVIDTNNVFDEISIKALDESDHVLVISSPDLPTVHNTKRCLSLFKMMGYSREKVLLVLNRHTPYDGIDLDDIEESMNYPIFKKIPNHDYVSVIRSINEGKPITMRMPDSKLSACFMDIAKNFNGAISETEMKPKEKKRFLKSLLKKSE